MWWLVAAVLVHGAEPEGDPARGEVLAGLGGCEACHTADEGPPYAGGHRIETAFGTYVGSNLTPDLEHGLGAWTYPKFERAMRHGKRPEGGSYFPAFPYPSFSGLTDADLQDLWAYLGTLPAVDRANAPHEVQGLRGWRGGLGLWRLLYFRPWTSPKEAVSEQQQRGAYLVDVVGHCGECHTPRNGLGALRGRDYLAGAIEPPHPAPNLTTHAWGLGGWSESDMASFLEDGMTPEGDFTGGEMNRVVRQGTAHLSDEDRRAMASWLAAVAARPGPAPAPEAAPEDEDW